ncbi:MAG: hypothetical protein SAK29_05400 [Scytonema sp. PMC 1069.18]|nr:hypothetical protein [Scytonema sp. PMC 1069.18]MEC4880670.1 hypothetical protein [Scytonema sp. PMC 1070.18]
MVYSEKSWRFQTTPLFNQERQMADGRRGNPLYNNADVAYR